MRVRFWGTRGSMPVALTADDVRDKLAQALVAADGRRFESFGAAYDFAQQELPFTLTHTFGGHSSCVELETGSNEYFVCDMGSGARPFGAHVLARQGGRPATVNVFMSHLHWDHIMGFPFFGPAYVPGTRIRIHGCHDTLEQALRLQQAPPCFPVAFEQLAAKIEFVKLAPGETYAAGGVRVTPKIQRHSGDSYGYRFEAGGKVLVYTTDCEHRLENRGEAEAFVAFFRAPTSLWSTPCTPFPRWPRLRLAGAIPATSSGSSSARWPASSTWCCSTTSTVPTTRRSKPC